jgi:hypothetical protein
MTFDCRNRLVSQDAYQSHCVVLHGDRLRCVVAGPVGRAAVLPAAVRAPGIDRGGSVPRD